MNRHEVSKTGAIRALETARDRRAVRHGSALFILTGVTAIVVLALFVQPAAVAGEPRPGGPRIRLGPMKIMTHRSQPESPDNRVSVPLVSADLKPAPSGKNWRSLFADAIRTLWSSFGEAAGRELRAAYLRPSGTPLERLYDEDDPLPLIGEPRRSLAFQFVDSMGRELLKKRNDLSVIKDIRTYQEPYYLDENLNQYTLYEGEMEPVSYVERDIIVNSLSHAVAETFERTPLGVTLKEIEARVTRFFTVEYSKGALDEKPTLYLPGMLNAKKDDAPKDYGISASSLFHVDADSLTPEVTMKLVAKYYGSEARAHYDISNNEASLSFENDKLNNSLGTRAVFAMIYDEDEELVGMVSLSYDF